MSGGVDSAVALLRAGAERGRGDAPALGRPARPERRARLLLARRRRSRARETCHALGPAARHARPARGVPRRRRGAVRRRATRPGLTPNPCTRCNGAFRFDALVAFADRVGADDGLDRALRARRRAGRDAPRRPRPPIPPRISRTCSRRSTRRCSSASGSRSASRRKDDVRAEAAAAGLAAARRPESQEACFLAGDDYRGVPRARGRRARRPGAIVDEDGDASRRARRASGTSRPGSGAASASPAPEPLYALRTDAATATVVVGPRRALAVTRVEVARRRCTSRSTRAEAKLRYRSARPSRARRADRGRLRARPRRRRRGRRARPGRRALRRRRRRGGRHDRAPATGSRSRRDLTLGHGRGIAAGDVAYWASPSSSSRLGVGSLFALVKLGELLRRDLVASSAAPSATCCP